MLIHAKKINICTQKINTNVGTKEGHNTHCSLTAPGDRLTQEHKSASTVMSLWRLIQTKLVAKPVLHPGLRGFSHLGKG